MEVKLNNDEDNNKIFTNKTINLLADGVIKLYQPCLSKTNKQLQELKEKQNVVVDQLHNENMKLAATQYSVEIQELFNLIRIYNHKLQNIKKSMLSLHERSIKMKKRSLRLQHHVEKDLYIASTCQQNKPSTSNNL